jgi:hypothetical protein
MASAQTVIIDGLQGETFLIRMVTSIRHLFVKNISPGQMYVFVLTQNNAGNHTVAWGAQALNATALDFRPHSITTITFIGQPGNILQANVAGAWQGPNTQLFGEDGTRRWRPRRLAPPQPSS